MSLVYAPMIGIGEYDEMRIEMNNELRNYLENHPTRENASDDDYSLFYIDITEEVTKKIEELCETENELKMLKEIKSTGCTYITVSPQLFFIQE